MSVAVQVQLKPNHSADPRKNALEDDDGVDTPTINDVESLRKAIFKTSKNKAKAPYTILLVGEMGVGKSSVLEFIANVFAGNDIDHYNFDVLDNTNERGGSNTQSRTNTARLYEFTSKNGIVVRILDTPGLIADTGGIEQDDLHKQSIERQIKNHIDTINAVLVLVNGTVSRVSVNTDYVLSTLSAIFPKTMAANIAFLFTNVSSPLYLNFSGDTVPDVLKCGPQFLLNNPIALQKKYRRLKNEPNMKAGRESFRKAVKVGEENALEMLVDLFDWLDGLEPQPTTEIVSLYDKSLKVKAIIEDHRAPKGQTEAKRSGAVKQKPTSIHTLKQSHAVSEVSQAQLEKTQGSLEQMLDLLKKAEEKIQEGIWKAIQIFFGK